MREILFRGQTRRYGEKVRMNGDKLPGNWVYGGCFQGAEDFSIIYGTKDESGLISSLDKYVVYSDTVGQYTGLTDMQDVKIFEGDIVQFGGEYGKIEYSETEAMFHVVFDGWLTDFDHLRGTEVNVVGNIHDNPELLEATV